MSAVDERLIGIGEAAARLGISIRTIRLYEERGLLRPAREYLSKHRRFDSAAMTLLAQILDLKAHGLTITEIREAIQRSKGTAPTLTLEQMEDHLKLLHDQRTKLDRKIELMEATLQRARARG